MSNAVRASAANGGQKLPSGISYEKIGSEIEEYVKEHEATMAGMEVAVFDRNGIIYQNQFGYINVEKKQPVKEDSVFGWGSVTKMLVWVSVMQLWEQDKIDLNADIKKYLPEGFLTNLKYDDSITMLHLMNHSAGFQEMLVDGYLEDFEDVLPLEEQLKAHEPAQVYQPGKVTAYSNWGTALAGYIVERISGQTFDTYVKENIFKKLGMEHTAIRPDLSDNDWVQKGRLLLHCYDADGTAHETSFYHIPLYPMGMCAGTLSDFQRFAQSFLVEEGKQCLLFKESATLEEMLSASAYYEGTNFPRISHGFLTMERGVHVLGHGGNSHGCSANMEIEPKSGVGVVVMTNQYLEEVYNEDMMRLIFGSFKDSTLADYNKQGAEGYLLAARSVLKGPVSLESMREEKMGYGGVEAGDEGFWALSESDGRKKIAVSAGEDYLVLLPLEYIPSAVLLEIAAAAICYAFFTCIAGGCIVRPVLKIRKKRQGIVQKGNWCDRWNYLVCALISVGAVFLGLFFSYLQENAFCKQYSWLCAANLGIVVFLVLALVWMLLHWRKIGQGKWKKLKYAVTLFFAVAVIAAAVRWQVFYFWAL